MTSRAAEPAKLPDRAPRSTGRPGAVSRTLALAEEQALVARAKSGDRRAFETLVRDNADRLYAVVLRFSASEADAEEAAQEAFIRAWRSLPRFRSDSRFFTWMYRIGVNEAKRIAERGPGAGTVVSVEEWPVDDISDDRPGPSPRAEQSELRDVLEQAVRRLPEKYRAPVVLRDIEGLTTEEAAEILGLHQAAFKSRLHRGRMALRRDVADYVVGEDIESLRAATGTGRPRSRRVA
jgi:RNA polymerase sigma-70 factor (ECF subfamily)